MQDDARGVTTFCPRCGRPIAWSVRPFEGGAQLAVTAFACRCPLRGAEWDDLVAAALETVDEEG